MRTAPQTVEELIQRAERLTGRTIGHLWGTTQRGQIVPPGRDFDGDRHKGRVGELVEQVLGATAGNLDQPDFPDLGIELKTIPLDEKGRVKESTFVCVTDLGAVEHERWEDSRVWRKLKRVLWVPVEAVGVRAFEDRRFGKPRLWSPDPAQERQLKADWEMIMGALSLGEIEDVDATLGEVLQLRPKAANASVTRPTLNSDGAVVHAVPRGFYLRARFTEAVLWS